MKYSEFKLLLKGKLARGDSLDSYLNSFVAAAVDKLNRECFLFQAYQTTLTTTADVGYVSLPDDFIRARVPYAVLDTEGNWLIKSSLGDVLAEQKRGSKGAPVHFAVDTVLYLYPVPDKEYQLDLHYFRYIPAPSSDNDEPVWLTTALWATYHGAMAEAWDFLNNNEEMAKAVMRCNECIMQLHSNDNRNLMTRQIRYNEF